MKIITITRKLLVSIISSVILSGYLVHRSYDILTQKELETAYWTHKELWILYLVYTVPAFLILGTVFSIFADRIIVKFLIPANPITLLSKILLYIFGGLIATYLFLLIISSGRVNGAMNETGLFLVLGVIGSVIYLILDEIAIFIVRKTKMMNH